MGTYRNKTIKKHTYYSSHICLTALRDRKLRQFECSTTNLAKFNTKMGSKHLKDYSNL